jgi:hypothetical protein
MRHFIDMTERGFAANSVSWSGRLSLLVVGPGLSQGKGNSLMASNKHEFKIATFGDGTCAILRADPAKPRLLEVIATFYDSAHARDYVRLQNTPSDEYRDERRPMINLAAKGKSKQASRAQPKQLSAVKPEQASKVKPKQASADNLNDTSRVRPKQAPAAQAKLAPETKPINVAADVSERQIAVLKASRLVRFTPRWHRSKRKKLSGPSARAPSYYPRFMRFWKPLGKARSP